MSSDGTLHVHDLPQLYTKPSTQALLDALKLLRKSLSTFEAVPPAGTENARTLHLDPEGVPGYLTGIISSSLDWLPDDDKEEVWELASKRLSERCGRNAAPAATRQFRINDGLVLSVHEPSLTEDSIGLKTWTSSLLLSRRLPALTKYLPNDDARILELGSGTGLVGLAASCIWRDCLSEVLLTDLPEIVPNLEKNIQLNEDIWTLPSANTLRVHSRVLDWSDDTMRPDSKDSAFPIIIAADPIYSADHPRMLTDTVRRWLKTAPSSRFILELPLREGYIQERQDLRQRLASFMTGVEQGQETGYDDWEDANGQAAEVECWWSVWRLKDMT